MLGDVPDDLAGATMKRIRANVLQPLEPDEDVSERHGWASVSDPFDTDLDHEKVFFNEYVTLAMRFDRWVIPGPLLKAHLREAEQKLLEKMSRPAGKANAGEQSLEKLGRKAKADLKVMVTKKLRRQLVPVTKSFDLVWNVQGGVALFFSHSKKTHELVQDLFEKTFKLRLLVESPGTAADHLGMTSNEEKTFAELEPTSLASVEVVA